MADLFRLADERWAVLEPFMPKNQPGARRVDDRRERPLFARKLTFGDDAKELRCACPESRRQGSTKRTMPNRPAQRF